MSVTMASASWIGLVPEAALERGQATTVHHRCVNRAGYIITKGYFLDVGNLKIARKNASFNHWCGTCAVFYFKARDFPSSVEDRQPYVFAAQKQCSIR